MRVNNFGRSPFNARLIDAVERLSFFAKYRLNSEELRMILFHQFNPTTDSVMIDLIFFV